MDRAERKRRQREIAAWNERKTFVQKEIIAGNYAAYAVGVGHALDAAATLFGIGDTRVQRFQEKLQLVQRADGIGDGAMRKPELDKAAAEFDKIYKFGKQTAAVMNVESYNVALDHIQDAVSIIYGLGQKRLEVYRAELARLLEEDQLADFMTPTSPEFGNPYALALRRLQRFETTSWISDQAKAAIRKLVE